MLDLEKETRKYKRRGALIAYGGWGLCYILLVGGLVYTLFAECFAIEMQVVILILTLFCLAGLVYVTCAFVQEYKKKH